MMQTQASGHESQSWANECGQNTVEFALVAVILVALTFGLIDFSWAVYAKSVVRAAAQEGARVGIATPVDSAIETAVRERAVGLNEASLEVQPFDVVDGNAIEVTVTYSYRFITPLGALSDSFPSSVVFESTASMVRR